MKKNSIFVITGPTAAGEDSIIDGLRGLRSFYKVTTTTTRDMREGESEGNPYFFVSTETFQDNIKNDRMVEYAEGTNGDYYGVTRQEFEKQDASLPLIWKVDYKGAIKIRDLYPDAVIIFITVPSDDVIARRLRARDTGATEEYIQGRLAYAKNWKKHMDVYDHVVVNADGELDASIAQVDRIIADTMNLSS